MTRRTLLLFVAALAGGCGGSASTAPPPLDFGGPDGKAVADLVDQFNEAKHDPKRAKGFFTGPPPAGHGKYDFSVQGAVSVTGTTATAKVRARPEAGTGEAVELDWAFEKVGEAWKIKTAPLPGK